MLRCSPWLAPLLATGLVACGSDHESHADAGYDCVIEDRDDTYAPNLEKAGELGTLTFRLVSSNPGPPARGDNDWQIEIVDGAAAPVAGAAVEVTPFMPDHRHGTPIDPIVTDQTAGRYQVNPVNLWMPGLWEITIQATPSGGAMDRVVYRFCIPG